MLRCLAPLAPLATSLSVVTVGLACAVACTDKPKVARAGVGEPTAAPSPTLRSGADSSTSPGISSGAGLFTPAPTPTPTATAEASPTATVAAGNGSGNAPGTTTGAAPGAGSPGGPSGAGQDSVLQPPADLPSAAAESELSRAECDKGNAVACMRLGAYFKSVNRREDAKNAYLAACVRAATVTPTACKVAADPQKSNARGCYEAGLMMVFDGDKAAAKVTLQCACDKGFSVACDDAKAL